MTQMHNPVFVDRLPDAETVLGRKSTVYRLRRNRALIDLFLDPKTEWTTRPSCPGCGTSIKEGKTFSRTQLHFLRCPGCGTIYADKTPSQQTLDRLRLDLQSTDVQDDSSVSSESVSLLNWIALTESRLNQRLARVLDVRFASHHKGWAEAARSLSQHREWFFLPLQPAKDGDPDFRDLSDALAEVRPQAVLITSELDRAADPSAFLKAIKDGLDPGSLIFVAASCGTGLEYEILGAESPSFVPLDRLTMFSIDGFKALSDRLGLTAFEAATPGRLDAVILSEHFKSGQGQRLPFWTDFFKTADKDQLHDLQILLQRSMRSGVMRFVLQV